MRLEDSFQAFFFLSFVPCDGIRSRAERANMFFLFESSLSSGSQWSLLLETRVAGWFIFKPKIPIWINLGGP
jgi:hypothetical protein